MLQKNLVLPEISVACCSLLGVVYLEPWVLPVMNNITSMLISNDTYLLIYWIYLLFSFK